MMWKMSYQTEKVALKLLLCLNRVRLLTPASPQCAALPAVQVVLPVQDVVLQSLWQRQEAHEDRRSQTKATKTLTDPQTAEMLQSAGVLWGG